MPFEMLSSKQRGEPSEAIRERVMKAREIQKERFKGMPGIYTNAQMTPAMMQEFVHVDANGLMQLKQAMERFKLSARAYDRILKVSRTIADLDASQDITIQHIGEAINYRKLDRGSWGTRTL